MPAIKRLETVVFTFQAALSIVLLAALCIIVLTQVVFRYGLDDPLYWSEEVSRFMFVWLSFIGFGVVAHRRQEMRVAFFFDRLPAAAKKWVSAATLVCMLATCALITLYGIELALSSHDVLSIAIELPWSWIFLAVPLGFSLVFIQYVLRLILVLNGAEGAVS